MTTRFLPTQWRDYALLDAGNGKRLERFGEVTVVRPDPFALWTPAGDPKAWQRADATFEPTGRTHGKWRSAPGTPKRWPIRYRSEALDLAFELEMTQFKHVGLFPEQADNWEFIAANLSEGDRFLNLFAYTGGASLAARQASRCHDNCCSYRRAARRAVAMLTERCCLARHGDLRAALHCDARQAVARLSARQDSP